MSMDRVNAPWTDSQVESLNAYQACGYAHPFTGSQQEDGGNAILIATRDGWVEFHGGPVVQTWAHAFMADWSFYSLDPTE